MFESLKTSQCNFHLYIFAFDLETYEILSKINDKYFTVISLAEFESDKLKKIKNSRTSQEYCWTCTPSVIYYVLSHFDLEHCIYLDADLYFFNSPKYLTDEMPQNRSVMITEHRYTKEYDQTDASGKYCVQFIYFKNTRDGLNVLNWWKERCIDWCFNRVEDGKFGDQKYLDDWLVRFDQSVYELENLGGGVAPWNVQQYKILNHNGYIQATIKDIDQTFNLIFYHFHGLSFYNNWVIDLGNYKITDDVIKYLYKPYILHIKSVYKSIMGYNSSLKNMGLTPHNKNSKVIFKKYKRKNNANYSFYSYNEIKNI